MEIEFVGSYNGIGDGGKNDRFDFSSCLTYRMVTNGEDFWSQLRKICQLFWIRGSYGLVGSGETGLQANPAAAHFLYLDGESIWQVWGYHWTSVILEEIIKACWSTRTR